MIEDNEEEEVQERRLEEEDEEEETQTRKLKTPTKKKKRENGTKSSGKRKRKQKKKKSVTSIRRQDRCMGSDSVLDKTKHFHRRGQEPSERASRSARTRVRAACERTTRRGRSERER